MTQREIYLSIKRDLRKLNMKLIASRLKDIGIGLIAGGLYLLSVAVLTYIVITVR